MPAELRHQCPVALGLVAFASGRQAAAKSTIVSVGPNIVYDYRAVQLLASHFPYEMSADKEGLWSFWNRYGFPLGANMIEGGTRSGPVTRSCRCGWGRLSSSTVRGLHVLMENGALRTLFPYGMELQRNGTWVLFNRGYKPVGMRGGGSSAAIRPRQRPARPWG